MLAFNTRQSNPVITSGSKHEWLSGVFIFGSMVAGIMTCISNLSNIKKFFSHSRLALFGVIASLAAAFDIEFDP